MIQSQNLGLINDSCKFVSKHIHRHAHTDSCRDFLRVKFGSITVTLKEEKK